LPPLIRLVRDPLQYESPHQAHVPPGSVADYCNANQGWTIGEQQETTVIVKSVDELPKRTCGRVAVLCPGPSLNQTWLKQIRKSYDLVLGVNHAAFVDGGVDWWFCLDDESWRKHGNANPRKGMAGCTRHFGTERNCMKIQDGLEIIYAQPPEGMQGLSAPVAMHFAFTVLGAASVDVYGADMDGNADFKGETHTGRTSARWEEERAMVAKVQAEFGSRLRLVTADTAAAPKRQRGRGK